MNPLKSIPLTVGLGFILAIIISLSLNHGDPANSLWSLATWLHVFFGIIWPDHLSNYYMYKFSEFESALEALKSGQASIEDIRSLKSAIPSDDFKGFWGETIHQISSNPRRSSAYLLTCKCPLWAGLKDPPKIPIRF